MLRSVGVSAVLCCGSVDAVVSSACLSSQIALVSCVSDRNMSLLTRVTGATLLPHPSHILPLYVGGAVLSLVECGWPDGASDRLLLSSPAAPISPSPHYYPRPPAISVLSRHSTAASSSQFVSAVWSCLARLRNANREAGRAWRGAGETEIACIRQLVSDRQTALALLSQPPHQPSMAAVCRPLVIDAWIDSLRQLLRLTIVNTGCSHAQADAIIQQ